MTAPETIRGYLAALNASLEVGLRSRRRILYEVADHLWESTQAKVREGDDPKHVWAQEVAAFGSPEEVAAGFESDFVGTLDKRLAVIATRLDLWMAQHPWGGAGLRAALVLALAAAIVGAGALFGTVDHAEAPAQTVLVGGALWSLYLGAKAWRLRRRPEPGLRDRMRAQDRQLIDIEPWGFVGGLRIGLGLMGLFLVYAIEGLGLSFFLVFVGFFLLIEFSDLIEWLARRGYEELAFRQHHPWSGALLQASFVPILALAAALLTPGPLGFRVALAVLVLACTALVAAVRCLAWNRDEKDTIQLELEGSSRQP